MSVKIHFLTYLNRSGSTLLAKKLDEFQGITVGIEADLVDGLRRGEVDIQSISDLKNYLNIIYKDPKFREWRISKNTMYQLLRNKIPLSFADFFQTTVESYCSNTSAKIFIHKSGRYFLFLNYIRKCFPASKIIFVYRDPRAIFNSQNKSIASSTGLPMNIDPVTFSRSYRKAIRIMQENNQHNDFIAVSYEDLILNERITIKKIIDFIGVADIPKNVSNYLSKIPDTQKHLHTNLQKGMQKERIDGWIQEMKVEQIAFIQYILKKELSLLNYEKIKVKLHGIEILEFLILLVKYIINYKNILESFRSKFILNKL